MPLSQALPAHKTSHENGGTDEIDATGLTGAGGGGAAQFDEVGSLYRLKPTFDTLAQDDLGDGSEGTIQMTGGYMLLTVSGTGPRDASFEMDGSTGDVTAVAEGDLELLVDGDAVVSIGGAAKRLVIAGGMGVTFPALAADPSPGAYNMIYFNTTTDKHRAWDGAAWNDLY